MTSRNGSGRKTTLADLEEGQRAELRAFRAERLERRCRALGLEPGTTVRCRARDAGALELVLPDGEAIRVDRAVAMQVRVARGDRPETTAPARGSDEPVPFLEELFQGGTRYL